MARRPFFQTFSACCQCSGGRGDRGLTGVFDGLTLHGDSTHLQISKLHASHYLMLHTTTMLSFLSEYQVTRQSPDWKGTQDVAAAVQRVLRAVSLLHTILSSRYTCNIFEDFAE